MNESYNLPFFFFLFPFLSFLFSPCNLLETMSTVGCVYPSTVWKCHPLRHDSRFGNTVDTNYLVNPGAHCNNCRFPSYKHIAGRFGTIKQQLFSQSGRNKTLGCWKDQGTLHGKLWTHRGSGSWVCSRSGGAEPVQSDKAAADAFVQLLKLPLLSPHRNAACLKRVSLLITENIRFYVTTSLLVRNSFQDLPLFLDPGDK